MNPSPRRFHTQSAELTAKGYVAIPSFAFLFVLSGWFSLFPETAPSAKFDPLVEMETPWVYLFSLALFGAFLAFSVWHYGWRYRTFDLSAQELVIRRWARKKPIHVYRPEDVVSFRWQEFERQIPLKHPHLLMETRDGLVHRFLWQMEDFETLVNELQRWSGKPVPQAERVQGRGNQSLNDEGNNWI
jgi:hypothetical protein